VKVQTPASEAHASLTGRFRLQLLARKACRAGGDSTHYGQRFQGTVGLGPKSPERAVSVGEAVEEAPVTAQGHIDRVATGSGHRRYATRADQLQTALGANPKAGNGAAAGIGSVSETSVMGRDKPAGGSLLGWHGSAKHLKITVS
jgi:hypothetical protein